MLFMVVDRDLQPELPNLLWMYMMGIVLFWIHDNSAAHVRTHRLVEHTVDMVARVIALASVPLLRPIRTRVLQLLADIRSPIPPGLCDVVRAVGPLAGQARPAPDEHRQSSTRATQRSKGASNP